MDVSQIRVVHVLYICNFLLIVCSAVIIELPLKKFKRSIEYDNYGDNGYQQSGTGDSLHRNYEEHSRMKRSTLQADLDLDGMVDNLKGESGEGYYTTIQIGTPPQELQVLIDTGSANFAIACQETANVSAFFHRDKSSTYSEDGKEISVTYTEGSWNGMLGTDLVALTSATSLATEANIACITESNQFYTPASLWQGILGFGYSKLSMPDSSVEPFWDSLRDTHPNISDVFSIQLCGSSFVHSHQKPLKKGSLILGGILPQNAKSQFFYTPIYKEWYYEIILTEIEVQRESLGLPCKEFNMDKTIVDSGTTSIRLPPRVFDAVKQKIIDNIEQHPTVFTPREGFFEGTDLMCYENISLAFEAFPVISFYLLSSESETSAFRMDLTPQHYLRPVSNFEDERLDISCVKYGFITSNTGTVLGAIFMEAFYTVFDRANKRIGFAQTSCPLPDPNSTILDVTIGGPYNYTSDLSKCAFKKPESDGDKYVKMTYILLAFSVIVFIPLILVVFFKVRKSFCPNRYRRHQNDEPSNALSMSDPMND